MNNNNTKYIGDFTSGRKNNFDFLRFVAASLVILSHSFPIATGNVSYEPLAAVTKQYTFGALSVSVFFIISGFFITQSYDRSKNLLRFLKSRILRLFPALAVVLLLSAFVLGPLVTTLPVREYLANDLTVNYLKAIFLHPIPYYLPGVFESNAYKGAVNGSIWTLEYEFLFYLIVGFLGVTKLLKKDLVIILFVLSLFLSRFKPTFYPQYTELFSYFSAGMVLYLIRDSIPLKRNLALYSLFIVLMASYLGGLKITFAIFGSYLIMYFAFLQQVKLSNFAKYGDFSYGIYIYAFPVQQLVTYLNGGKMNANINFLIAFVITLICSFFSWHIIEKNFLKLKKFSILDMLLQKFNIKKIYSHS